MRTVVLFDGEHYPPVVQAAVDALPDHVPDAIVVGAVLLGGTEKLRPEVPVDLGVPVVTGPDPEEALVEGLVRFAPEQVVDLADEPVVDARQRLRLVAACLLAGARYRGADFRVEPPPRPRIASKPAVAVIGTGKRTGKTAVSVQLARLLSAQGTPPVIVAMGRGGPAEPEVVDPASFDLSMEGLLAMAQSGRHAASDHLEGALFGGVTAVGTRRCGGGLAGAPFESTFADGVRLANGRGEQILLLEGSGQAIPPVHADATICVVAATADPELVTGYLGAYRLLLSDAVVVTMVDTPLARSGAVAALEESIRGLAPGIRIVHTVFRPNPLAPVTGKRIVYATTAPPQVSHLLTDHLEREFDCTVVGVTHNLASRPQLQDDLAALVGEADVLVVELKAAAIDLAARVAVQQGIEVVFCDNRVVTTGGDGPFEDVVLETAGVAVDRFRS
jgi:cyclic 2,3-diphosphoglycerate synthase